MLSASDTVSKIDVLKGYWLKRKVMVHFLKSLKEEGLVWIGGTAVQLQSIQLYLI